MRSRTPGRARGLATLRRRLLRPGLATALLAACLVLAAAFVAIAVQGNAIAREIAATQSEIERLRGELGDAQAEAAYKQTDEYLRQQARVQGYVVSGESLIAVDHDALPPVSVRDPERVTGRLQRWLDLFIR